MGYGLAFVLLGVAVYFAVKLARKETPSKGGTLPNNGDDGQNG